MRRVFLAVVALALISAVYVALRYDTQEVRAAAGGATVTWEAEHQYADLEAPFERRTGDRWDKQPRRQKQSGTGCVVIPDKANGSRKEGDGSSLPGKATYKIRVPQAGQYTVWARTLWPNGCGNSFWIRQPERPNQLLGEDGTYDVWKWRKLANKMTFAAGTNTIVVGNREDGVVLDQLQITTTSRQPAGAVAATANAVVQ